MYNAIVFPVYAVLLAARRLLTAGFGTERAICQLGFGEQDAANADAEASSALERSSCSLVKEGEQRLRLFKNASPRMGIWMLHKADCGSQNNDQEWKSNASAHLPTCSYFRGDP